MSTRPKRATAAATILSQASSLAGAAGEFLDLRAALAALRRDFRKFLRLARGEHELRAGRRQRFRRHRAEGAGSAGDDRDFAGDLEQRERIGRRAGHGFAPGG